VKRTSPIHRRCSVPRSLSATIPTDWDRKDRYRLSPWVMEIKSSGVWIPFTVHNAAILGLPVPLRFQLMALPEPQGRCTTAIFESALAASSFLPKPLKTSCGSPSPEHDAMTSYASMSSFSAMSTPWPENCVLSTSTSQRAAANIGSMSRIYHFGAFPLPLKGLIRTLIRFLLCEPPYARSSSLETQEVAWLCSGFSTK